MTSRDDADREVVDAIANKPMDAWTSIDKLALLALAVKATAQSEMGTSDTARLDWLETLPCGITINADRDHEAILRTRQHPGYLRELIDQLRVERRTVGDSEEKQR